MVYNGHYFSLIIVCKSIFSLYNFTFKKVLFNLGLIFVLPFFGIYGNESQY